jgi:hypothetical protein
MKPLPWAIRVVYKSVTTENLIQMKCEFAVRARDMVRELIREHFNVRLHEVLVGRLLRKGGLSPQGPTGDAGVRAQVGYEL